jgi:hypothetical protein
VECKITFPRGNGFRKVECSGSVGRRSWKNNILQPLEPTMKNLTKTLGDIAVIVFSVLLATWLENLRQKLDETDTAREFLQGVSGDLRNDLREMRLDKASYRLNQQGFTYFAGEAQNQPLNGDSLKKYQSVFFSSTRLIANDGAFQGFKSSGKLYSIQDRELRGWILDLYQERIPSLLLSTDGYIERKKRLNVYYDEVLDRYSAQNGAVDFEKVLRSPLMQRHFQGLTQVDEVQEQYDITIALVEKIIKAIEAGRN